jgi:hypothetical protein
MAAARFALLITPAESTDEERADFSDSFRRVDPSRLRSVSASSARSAATASSNRSA